MSESVFGTIKILAIVKFIFLFCANLIKKNTVSILDILLHEISQINELSPYGMCFTYNTLNSILRH